MMFALGCIQSRHCNQDTCPTGIATQNPARYKALDVGNKSVRVANYHASIIKNLMELVATAGLDNLNQLRPCLINRRVRTLSLHRNRLPAFRFRQAGMLAKGLAKGLGKSMVAVNHLAPG